MSVADRIRALSKLEPNWDSYGSPQIEPMVVERALSFIGGVQAIPTTKGGIQFEWHQYGWDIEIELGPDGKVMSVLVARVAKENDGR